MSLTIVIRNTRSDFSFSSSIAIPYISLYWLSKSTGRKFIFLFDYAKLIPFAVTFFVVASIIVFFTVYKIDQRMDFLTAKLKNKFRNVKYTGNF